jgi:GNAT superfamily N-acetyltransferase
LQQIDASWLNRCWLFMKSLLKIAIHCFALKYWTGRAYSINVIGSVRGYHEKRTTFIGRLIVKPESQNKGIRTRLMHAIEQRHESADRYELFTGYKSARFLHLYRKLGYDEFKRIPVDESLTVFLEKYNNDNNQ